MKLHADNRGTSHYIQRFDGDTVEIGGQRLKAPLIVSADTLITAWEAPPLASLALEDVQAALDLEPELILLGTGAAHRFANPALAYAIGSRGIGFEVMATAAACRTYNVLVGEDRRVVAILLPG